MPTYGLRLVNVSKRDVSKRHRPLGWVNHDIGLLGNPEPIRKVGTTDSDVRHQN